MQVFLKMIIIGGAALLMSACQTMVYQYQSTDSVMYSSPTGTNYMRYQQVYRSSNLYPDYEVQDYYYQNGYYPNHYYYYRGKYYWQSCYWSNGIYYLCR